MIERRSDCGEKPVSRVVAHVLKRLAELSAEPVGMAPAEMARFMKEEAERWRNAIRTAGLKTGEL